MSDIATTRRALLDRRLAGVGDLAALTAEEQRLQMSGRALAVDRLRIETAMERAPGEAGLVRDLHTLETEEETLRSAMEACAERIRSAERSIEDIDRRLTATNETDGEEPPR